MVPEACGNAAPEGCGPGLSSLRVNPPAQAASGPVVLTLSRLAFPWTGTSKGCHPSDPAVFTAGFASVPTSAATAGGAATTAAQRRRDGSGADYAVTHVRIFHS